jgi:DNA polymerase II large subunit
VTESEHKLPAHSISYEQYFESLSKEVETIYEIARDARLKGFDPTTRVEIPPAHDVAARVEATLEGPSGVAKRIRELQKEHSREQVAFAVAKEIAEGTLGNITDSEKAADKAVRVALSVLTESITAAPLEGIAKVRIRGSGDERYLALYLAGPIRAAGGTEAAMTVLVADYVRQVLDLPPFKSTDEETERALEEVELYARNVHLQYPVHPELITFAASRLPIMLTGEPTEEFEVSGGRDLDRIETNRVRGGAVLVLNDGVVGRAAKLAKIVNQASIKGWEWLDDLAARTSKAAKKEEDSADKKLEPKYDYLADVIGGRPVFSHPQRIGGFRLRYGRSRNTGLAGVGVHPATMYIVKEFLAPGTHIRTERPGKGSIVAPVDTIEGPIVLLKDGSVVRITDVDDARRLEEKVKRVIFIGDILIALGEFLENNHPLVPSGYCEEWWSHDLEYALSNLSSTQINNRLKGSNLTPDIINEII